jgi:hypothetical protein
MESEGVAISNGHPVKQIEFRSNPEWDDSPMRQFQQSYNCAVLYTLVCGAGRMLLSLEVVLSCRRVGCPPYPSAPDFHSAIFDGRMIKTFSAQNFELSIGRRPPNFVPSFYNGLDPLP